MDEIKKFEEEVGVTFYEDEDAFGVDDVSEEEMYNWEGGVVNE